MVPVYRYAVSYLRGRDEAWVSRFLEELGRRLETVRGPGFRRLVPPVGAPDGRDRDRGSYGVETADIVLALCSPAYFSEGPARHDWAVLALRRSLGQARTGAPPRTALPLIWEPIDRRLPGPVATADTFSAGQPPEYRSLGLALMTMQAPRHRAALDRVLDGIVAAMTSAAEGAPAAPPLEDRSAGEPPDALAADDGVFTERFRKEVTPLPPAVRVPRSLSTGGDGATAVAAERLPEVGRRILLVGPTGSGHSTELARLAARALDDTVRGPGGAAGAPWGCRVPFVLSARSGALPTLDGLVPTLAPLAAPQEPAGWAARQLRSGRAFLAVDDLDAVPVRGRAAVWESLLRLLRGHPQAPCVIATNGTGVPWAGLDDGFRTVGLRPLPPAGVHELLASLAPAAAEDRQAALALLRQLDGDPVLVGVAARPASAAALLRAARAHGGPGPVPRHRLLRAGVSASWRRPGGEPPGPEASPASASVSSPAPSPTSSPASSPAPEPVADQVPDSVLRAASGRLAVAALGLDSSRIPLRTALGALRESGDADPASTERLLATLADRAGVVFRPGPDTVAFPGPEVRTFLAARHLAHAPGGIAEEVLGSHPSAELVLLLAQLRAAGDEADAPRSVLAAVERPLRRLSAAALPSVVPTHRAATVVRSSSELSALLVGGADIRALRCAGPVTGLADALPFLPALRSLVLTDDPSLVALPALDGCRSLRSVRVLRCPALRDLTALESSTVMFLDIDPWPDLPVPDQVHRAPWLTRVDLVSPGTLQSRPATPPPRPATVFPGIHKHLRTTG